MSKQRCLVCFQIKSSTEFALGKKETCDACINRSAMKTRLKYSTKKKRAEVCSQCGKKVQAVNEDGWCQVCVKEREKALKVSPNKLNKQKAQNRTVEEKISKLKRDAAKIIVELVQDNRHNTIVGFEEIELKSISYTYLYKNYSLEELVLILTALNR